MTIEDKAVLVTGASRGIGQAPVVEALRRGAKRVCAGEPQPLAHLDGRVTPLALSVTGAEQIQRWGDEVDTLDLLINNAGIAIYDKLNNSEVIEQNLGINFFGPPGPIDTNMNRSFELSKASPESAALRMFDGLEKGEDEIFSSPAASQSIAEGRRTGCRQGALEPVHSFRAGERGEFGRTESRHTCHSHHFDFRR